MADKIVFPIVFDVEGGVKDAESKAKAAMASLQKVVESKQLNLTFGYVDTTKQERQLDNIRNKYQDLLAQLNNMFQQKYNLKVEIDKAFESDIAKINAEIARLRETNLKLGAKGDVEAIRANLDAIQQLEREIEKINKMKIDFLNTHKLTEELKALQHQVAEVFANLQKSERAFAKNTGLNEALDQQSQRIKRLLDDIAKIDKKIAQMNATGSMYDAGNNLSSEAENSIKRRIALTERLSQASTTGAQAQIDYERKLQAAKRETEKQELKNQRLQNANNLRSIASSSRAAANDIGLINQRVRELLSELQLANRQMNTMLMQMQRNSNAQISAINRVTSAIRGMGAASTHTSTQASRSAEKVTAAYEEQTSYVERLIKRMAIYASFTAFGTFIQKIREVTAQFELQRISLGAIIRDQQRANQLFAEIKNFALKSPVKILDLTTYTKQLAAYRIETDKLFDTTKRLADISVGLGVSMDRLVLFYGQVRATGYLRASEVRQATEAGIPLVEELARKLSQANGELVRAADVMDMISKREISFEQVAEVFEDMTNKGGVFYDMQIKQGNTLYGMWQKLGDAAAMMYDEIGNTATVNERIKSTISILRSLFLHWKQVGIVLGGVTAYIIAYMVAQKNATIVQNLSTAAAQKNIIALERKVAALQLEAMHLSGATAGTRLYTWITLQSAKAQYSAATATNGFSKALKGLWAALLANPFTALIIGLSTVIMLFQFMESEMDKLQSKIGDINAEYTKKSKEMTDNFKKLADTAVNSVDGSKKQKEALDELSRTYSSILGNEELELKNLRELKGEYSELTDIINAYNEKRKGDERETAIKTAYESTIKDIEEQIKDLFKATNYNDTIVSAAFAQFKQDVADGIDVATAFNQNISALWKQGGGLGNALRGFSSLFEFWNHGKFSAAWSTTFSGNTAKGMFAEYVNAMGSMDDALEENRRKTVEAQNAYGMFADTIDDVETALNSIDFSSYDAMVGSLQTLSSETLDLNEVLKYDAGKVNSEIEKDLETTNAKVALMLNAIKVIVSKSGKEIPEEFFRQARSVIEGETDFTFIDFDKIYELIPGADNAKARAAIREIQNFYQNLVPQDTIVKQIRNNLLSIAQSFKGNKNSLKKYLWDGSDSVEEYLKRLKTQIEDYKKRLHALKNAIVVQLRLKGVADEVLLKKSEEMERLIAVLEEQATFTQNYVPPTTTGSGRSSDTRLSELNEIEKSLTTIYKKYEELKKKESDTKALEHINTMYKEQLAYINQIASKKTLAKYGLHFDMPTSFTSLQEYREQILNVIKKLKESGLKGADKAAVELAMTIGTANADEEAKKIEKKLKELQEKVSHTKTAKDFFDKILNITGDTEIATTLSLNIYGENGEGVTQQMINYLSELFGEFNVEIPVIVGTGKIDWSQVRKLAEAALAAGKIGKDQYGDIIKMVTDGEKDLASVAENFAKLIMNYDEIAQQRINIENKYAQEVKAIDEGLALWRQQKGKEATEEEINQMNERAEAAKKAASAEKDLNLLKLSSEYMRYFSAIDTLTRKEAETLRNKVRTSLFNAFQQGKLSASELKKELKAVDEQFNKLIHSSGYLRTYLEGGFDAIFNKIRNMSDELVSLVAEFQKMKSPDEISEGQKSFLDKVLGKFGNDKTGHSFSQLFEKAGGDTKIMADNLKDCVDGMEGMVEGGMSAVAVVDLIIKNIDATIQGIAQIRDQLNDMRSEDMEGGMWDAFEYLENFNKYAASGWNKLKSGDIPGAIADTISSFISIFQTAQTQKIRKLDKEIERQGELIKDLEYTYSRLEKTMDKAFGSQKIQNYNQMLRNLQAQQQAYLKQAAAESEKGKKADKAKIAEYQESARQTADAIKDMADTLKNAFLGTDITSAARDFARSWIEAYASYASTVDAIQEKFSDMITNLIVEALAARLIESALTPIYSMIDRAAADENFTTAEVVEIANKTKEQTKTIQNGMQMLLDQLVEAGLDIGDILTKASDKETNFKGIARDIASASEESITGLAAYMNTQNYYIAQITTDVSLIRQFMQTGSMPIDSDRSYDVIDLVSMQNSYLQHLPQIAANTAATVERCERAAIACQNIAENLSKVMTTSGGKRAIATTLV